VLTGAASVFQFFEPLPGEFDIGRYKVSVWWIAFLFFLGLTTGRAYWQLRVKVAAQDERLTPRLSIHGPPLLQGAPLSQWKWLVTHSGALTPVQWTRIPIIEVRNESAADLQHVRAQITEVDPHEVAIHCPFDLPWYVAERKPLAEELSNMAPEGNGHIAVPPYLGGGLTTFGPWILTIRAWAEGTMATTKRLRTDNWRGDYPSFSEVPDE
jgi:hypothetical protein